MADIKKAFSEEQEYLRLRGSGEEPVSLLARVQACGFETLEDYFSAKREYEIEGMEFSHKEVSPETAANEMLRMVVAGKPGLLIMNTDKVVVYHGDAEFNRDYCEEHDIPVIEYMTNGGTLVASSGELSIGVCIPIVSDANEVWFLNKIATILSKYMDGVSVSGNDILVDGKKVCGAAMYQSDTSFSAVAQFSFDDKSELIKNICPAPHSGKVPGYISKMTRDQLRGEILEWL